MIEVLDKELEAPPQLEAHDLVAASRQARLFAVLIVAMLLVSVLLLIFAPWQQSIRGTGRVIALTPVERAQTIDAPVEGRISKWYVVEGTRVEKGDLIVDMEDYDPNLLTRLANEKDAVEQRIEAAKQREASLSARITELQNSLQAELNTADFKIQMALDRARAAEQTLEAAGAKRIAAEQNINRLRLLQPKGLASTRQVEVAQADERSAQAEQERSEATLSAARSESKSFETDRRKIQAEKTASINDAKASRASAQADIANAVASLQQIQVRLARQSTQSVRAPRDGTIFRLLAQPYGEVLKAGEAVATFVPDTQSRAVELLINGNDMPLVSKGRKVRLQFQGWPAIQFVGWPSVAVGTFGGMVELVDSTDMGGGNFRILVVPGGKDEPWPSMQYLRQGVRVNGWVLLNQVPLGFEMWRQFNGFPPVVAPTSPEKKGGK
ncbi:MAG: HlyD family efflux transporter periplasmic adaptor subunit [Acidobacteriaceae bacterium]|nr:HlyD family efflux transporter periplasmic adaptor subunit [Acidobacteriaceae bacterium]